jgi:biotin carboxyl carrier protein
MKYITTIGEREFAIEVIDQTHILVDGEPYTLDFDSIQNQPVYSLLLEGQSHEAFVYPNESGWQVLLNGQLFPAMVEDESTRRLRRAMEAGGGGGSGEAQLRAPMPGLVVAVLVSEGQEVERGEVLVILESMKMQNELKSTRAGRVSRLKVRPGDSVEQRQTLLSIS